jgi:hypothetical protein
MKCVCAGGQELNWCSFRREELERAGVDSSMGKWNEQWGISGRGRKHWPHEGGLRDGFPCGEPREASGVIGHGWGSRVGGALELQI